VSVATIGIAHNTDSCRS